MFADYIQCCFQTSLMCCHAIVLFLQSDRSSLHSVTSSTDGMSLSDRLFRTTTVTTVFASSSVIDIGRVLRYSESPSFKEPQLSAVTETASHMVYSADGQYLAVVTPENEIYIWRAQYNGEVKQYVRLASYKQKNCYHFTI